MNPSQNRHSRSGDSSRRSPSHTRGGSSSYSSKPRTASSSSHGGGARSSYRSGGASSSRSYAPRTGGGHSRGGSTFTHRPHSGGRGGSSSGGGRGRGGRKMPTFDPSQFINKNPIEVVEEVYEAKHKFTEFGLDKKLAFAITSSGMTTPTPIQDQIIPEILNGNDVIGLAQTGTGKTAAFLIPLIEKTIKQYSRVTLILAPTRELALQIDEELKKLSKGFKLFSTVCVG